MSTRTERQSERHLFSIRQWLTFPAILVLISSIVIVGFILIRSSVDNALVLVDELLLDMEANVNTGLREKLFQAEQLNETNHAMFAGGILNTKSVDREVYFSNILKSYPDAAMSFIGLEDGSFYGARRNLDESIFVVRCDESTQGGSFYYSIDSRGVGTHLQEENPPFDPRTRLWYKVAAEAGGPAYSDVYIHFTFQEPTITASRPVYDDDGRLVGVFGVNCLLSWMDELLAGLRIGEQGQIVITDENGRLIASTLDVAEHDARDDKVDLLSIGDIDNPYLNTLVAYIEEGCGSEEMDCNREGQPYVNRESFQIDDKEFFVGSMDFLHSNLNWKLYFLISSEDFLGNIDRGIQNAILLLGALILLSIFLSSVMARRIGKPIEQLSVASERLMQGNLEPIVYDDNIAELNTLAHSFNEMAKQLTNMMSNLERQVSVRTEELEFANQELQKLSFKDGLTGIYNRRKFDELYQKAWLTALRRQMRLGILMLDIDYFKRYNDTYGHLAGDDCLKLIAEELEGNLRRSTDVVARYGGEEFIVLIEEVQEDGMFEFADRLRQRIEDLNIEHISSEFTKVTVSIGVSYMIPHQDAPPHDLIRAADEALYQAKESGRNAVCLYTANGMLCGASETAESGIRGA